MAPPISTSLHHLLLPLFLAFSVTAAGPNHGIGPRKTGKGHHQGGGGGKKGGLPIQPVPVQPLPGKPLPGQPVPVQPIPGKPLPGQPLPGKPLPGQPLPGKPLPGQPLPGKPLPGKPVPGKPLPGKPLPGQPVPVQPLPGKPVPGQPLPGKPLPVQPVPGQPLPGKPLPVQPVPIQPIPIQPIAPVGDIETNFKGSWAVDNPNVGVAAMQFQLMPNNKAVWFDTTSLGPSARELGPPGNCPKSPEMGFKPDCFAHAIAYDVETGQSRTIYMDGEPWCSSGNLWPNGDLVATGGTRGGYRSVRVLSMADPKANFVEKKDVLGDRRWYSSNHVLEDGSALVAGGRNSFSYEIVPPNKLEFTPRKFRLPFLQETTVPKKPGPGMYVENNLYPFLFLVPDGNMFLFANDRGIIFHPHTGSIVRQFPKLQGGARNYPPSGMAALLPLNTVNPANIEAEVVICGGNAQEAYESVDAKHTKDQVFMPALRDCHRIMLTDHKSVWVKEQDMPSGRCMGDLLHLPTGDLLMLNGAKKGTAGWENAIDPNFHPILYTPYKPMGQRFKEMAPTKIARMYHSVASLIPDGKILVAGSNPHSKYLVNAEFPTELRVEKFSPHYLDPALNIHRPTILPEASEKVIKYGKEFKIAVKFGGGRANPQDVKVTMYYPPFTTHGFSMNQRLVILPLKTVANDLIIAIAPPSGKIAPPGYYMLFVNFRGVPGKAIWIHID